MMIKMTAELMTNTAILNAISSLRLIHFLYQFSGVRDGF